MLKAALMRIDARQVAKFQADGFLVLERFINSNWCKRLKERAQQLVEDFQPQTRSSIFSTREQNRLTDKYFLESGDKIRFFFEEDAFLPDGTLKHTKELSINKIGHALHDLDPTFDKFSRSAEIRELTAELGVVNPLLLQSMYIFKQPAIGGEVTCHQDSTFLYTEPTDIVGLWFALEDATIENGCLWVIPRGQRLGLKSRWIRTNDDEMQFEVFDPTPFPEAELVPLEVPSGTLIVLHGLLPHRSLANRSPRSRHAYTLHVISGDSKYAKSNWLQRSESMPLRGFD
jgi:phytanoyl-CoA hydroxylase